MSTSQPITSPLDDVVSRFVAGSIIALATPAATSVAGIAHAGLNGLSQQQAAQTGAYLGLIADFVMFVLFLWSHCTFVQVVAKLPVIGLVWIMWRLFQPRTALLSPPGREDEPEYAQLHLTPHTAQNWIEYNKRQAVMPSWKLKGWQVIQEHNRTIEGDADVVEPQVDDPDALLLYTELQAGRYPSQKVCCTWTGWNTDRWNAAVKVLKDAGLVIVEPRKPMRLNTEYLNTEYSEVFS